MNRDDVIARLQPLLEQLADGVAELASDMARDHLVATLEALQPAPPKPIRTSTKRRKLKASKRPAKAAKAKAAAGAKSGRQNHCRKCGAAGFQTKTCGRTHNVASAPGSKRIALTPEQIEEMDEEM